MTTEPTPPTRRWFQFRLRTLLVVMFVVSVGLGWVMKERRRIAERRERLEGAFLGSNDKVPLLPQPSWHRILYGEDEAGFSTCFVATVDVSDSQLPLLKELSQLKDLSLNGTQVTDAGLIHVAGLTQLKWLNLENTRITDAGLRRLQGLTQLEYLHLEGSQVTDAGVAKLQAALPNCKIYR